MPRRPLGGVAQTCSTCQTTYTGASCPVCAQGATWRAAPQGHVQSARTGADPTLAIVGLLLNILILPGLGSLIGGRIQEGIWQLVLSVGSILLAVILFITIVGILLLPIVFLAPVAAWIWGLVTGIQMVSDANKPTPAHHNA